MEIIILCFNYKEVEILGFFFVFISLKCGCIVCDFCLDVTKKMFIKIR